MLLTDIHHTMPVYRDCTLVEVIVVSLLALSALMLVLVIFTNLIWGYGWIGCIVALLLWVHVSRFLLSRLQKLKVGKPYGYYQHVFIKKMSNSAFRSVLPISYVQRLGKWSVQRRNQESL